MGLFNRKKNQPASSAASSRDVLVASADSSQNKANDPSGRLPTETAVATGMPAQTTVGDGLKAVVEKMRVKGTGQVTLSLTQSGNEMSYTLYQRGQEIESGLIEPGSEWFTPVADLYVEEEQGERGAWTRALIVVNPAIGSNTAVHVSYMNTEVSRTHNLNYSLDLRHLDAVVSRAMPVGPVETVEQRISRVSARLNSEEPVNPAPARLGAGTRPVNPARSLVPALPAKSVVLSGQSSPMQTSTVVPERNFAVSEPMNVIEPLGESGLRDEEERNASLVSGNYVAQPFVPRREHYVSTADGELMEPGFSATGPETSEPVLGGMGEERGENLSLSRFDEAGEPEDESGSEVITAMPLRNPLGAVHSESANQYPATGGYFEEARTTAYPGQVSTATEFTYDTTETTSPEPVSAVPASTIAGLKQDKPVNVGDATLPSHIDDSEFGADEEPASSITPSASVIPAAPSKIAAATLDAPMNGTGVDVAPSYSGQSQVKPSEAKKADGNLVLTEAEVVSRLAPAYDALFGAKGTALDVSTVLIRVRTLGSYYDALTHVRRNGFWEQVRTFDLIPEEILGILQLKADSYKEGYGSPLAINLRFTPGIPVAASFDYADEEAFVRYPEHLPAQQYVEELRMFPRTGANIPAHMSEALASWNL